MSTSNSSKRITFPKIHSVLLIQRKWFSTAIKIIWSLFFITLILIPLYFVSVKYNFWGFFGKMPDMREIENPENDLSSEIMSADGISLGRYFRYNRSNVTFDQLSAELVQTLVASEDKRYYEHSGLDFISFLRALAGKITFNKKTGGGSTITQQLAKNLFTMNRAKNLDGPIQEIGGDIPRIVQKTKEWIISVYLEKTFTKHEIIALYLNTSEFGNNTFGIKVASETYFKTSPDKLNLQQSAMLVGMLQNPVLFNPKQHPDRALEKRREIFYELHKQNLISRKEYDSLKTLPLELKFNVQNQNAGLAPYFRTILQQDLLAWCNENGYNLWNSGLKIYTTIDSKMQRYAEEAMKEEMRSLQTEFYKKWDGKNPWVDENNQEVNNFLDTKLKSTGLYKKLIKKFGPTSDSVEYYLTKKKRMKVFSFHGEVDTLYSTVDSLSYYLKFLQAGFVVMDASSGRIKAWVGGINYKYFKFDHVKQSKRQPGSTFKPFVFGLAMENGYSPCHKLFDVSPTFNLPNGSTWSPKNSDGTYGSGEEMTLRKAMALSVNSITAQMMQKLKPENVVAFAKRLGIKSELEAVPALCLGVNDVSLLEMAGAYSSFVNMGYYTEPFYITHIEDKNGNLLESFVPKTRQAISEQVAYKMVYMLRGGVEIEGATSQTLNEKLKKDNELGGKTGTTSNGSDGWYMGVTRDLVGGAWVGGRERVIRFPTWSSGQGGRTARPIWERFLLKVYGDASLEYKKGLFRQPQNFNSTLDCEEFVE